MADLSPTVIVIGGPNGAGKTTASRTILAEALRVTTYVNADMIAQGLAAYDPESAAVEAGRIMLERLRTLADQRADFAFETTLAGRGFAARLQTLREVGYHVHLVYFWLASVEIALNRIAARVLLGGHHVPEPTVRQRYRRSLVNFFHLYRPLADSWKAYNNTSLGSPSLVAQGDHTGGETVIDPTSWQQMQAGASA